MFDGREPSRTRGSYRCYEVQVFGNLFVRPMDILGYVLVEGLQATRSQACTPYLSCVIILGTL